MTTRLQGGEQRFTLAIKAGTDPKVASAAIARFHRGKVAEAKQHNRKVLVGGENEITTVDGQRGAPLESVKPDGGRIVTTFPFAVREILQFIDYLLIARSPVGPPGGAGTYNRSHRLFADGIETDPENPNLNAKEFIFTSNLPYARKVERGQGTAPKEGIYQGAVDLAKQRFGTFAYIRFTFQGVAEAGSTAKSERSLRYPAIRVRLR